MQHFWDQRYNDEEFAYGTAPNAFFKATIDPLKPGKILLVAEGEGRNAVYAALKGWEVTAYDFSPVAKEKALQLANQKGVELTYNVCSHDTISFEDNSFDAIAIIYVHQPEKERKKLHQTLINKLKKGGRIILETFNKSQLNNRSGGPKDPHMLYSEDDLRNDFQALTVKQLESKTIQLEEGEFHVGKADVVRLIAER